LFYIIDTCFEGFTCGSYSLFCPVSQQACAALLRLRSYAGPVVENIAELEGRVSGTEFELVHKFENKLRLQLSVTLIDFFFF